MIVDTILKLYQLYPPIRGKAFLERKVIAPLIRRMGNEIVVDMKNPGGGKLFCHLNDWIPWNVIMYGNYYPEKNYENFMIPTASNCKVIFDVGANIGYYTVQFGRVLRKDGITYSFEPLSYQYGVLERNIKLNKLENVITNKLIVSDSLNEKKRIYFSGINNASMNNTGSSSLEKATDEYEDVECITIDNYCEKMNIDRIDLIKIDVEGHELNVLKGMRKFLFNGNVGSLFIEINNVYLSKNKGAAHEIVSFLEQFGYKPFSISTGKPKDYLMIEDESLVFFRRDT